MRTWGWMLWLDEQVFGLMQASPTRYPKQKHLEYKNKSPVGKKRLMKLPRSFNLVPI